MTKEDMGTMTKDQLFAVMVNQMVKKVDEEIFVKIKGYEDIYEISNRGRIYNVKTKEYLVTSTDRSKATQVCLTKNNQKNCQFVHRLVADHFLSNPDPNKFTVIVHLDNDSQNNDVRNLEFMTLKEAIAHSNHLDNKRNTFAKKYGMIVCINGEQTCNCRTEREASEATGVSKSAIDYAIKHHTSPHGWSFYREVAAEEGAW